MAKSPEIKTFEDFWPYYLGEHRLVVCRAWHYVGSSIGLLSILALVVTLNPWWLLVGLIAGYGCAWIGHFFFEHNRPATFDYPWWSFIADYKMYGLALRGKMKEELSRQLGRGSKTE